MKTFDKLFKNQLKPAHMYTRKQMAQMAKEQQARLEAAGLASTNYQLMNEMEQIIEECQTESSTAFINIQYFQLGQFSDNKRAITLLIKQQTARPKSIKGLKDVHLLIRYLYDVEKVAFHPDDDFNDYVCKDATVVFSPGKAKKLNKLMEQAFDVCERAKVCLYGMCNVEFRLRYMHLFQ